MDISTTHGRLGSAASSFLAGKHQLLIDGKWVDAKSGKRFDVFDPATGQAIAAVAEAEAADVDEAVKAARRAFDSGPWARTSPADRCKLIWFKQSGWGREMGFEAIELYTEVKAIAAAL